jgi:cell division protein ZapE
LTTLKGEKDPLRIVGARISAAARVVCFDEFFVADIGDAMILAGLLQALFEQGTVMVSTSNIEPQRLYENGLQRQRFLPAIALIEAHMRVVELDGETDYRLRSLSKARLFHSPLDELAEPMLRASFEQLSPDFAEAEQDKVIEILGRPIASRFCSDDVIWFDFEALCDGPRSAFDYVEIARLYHAVLLGEVPQLGPDDEDRARRLINLVDELYDRGVKLIMTAAVPLDSLYVGGRLLSVFERTRSRQLEMQSHDYLTRPHRP